MSDQAAVPCSNQQQAAFNPSYVGVRTNLLRHISGGDNTVLDVGCANGVNGRYLKDKGKAAAVWGFEADPQMALAARAVMDRVFEGDIEAMDLAAVLAGQRFDYMIFGDVLEHLADPWRVLPELVSALDPGGKAIISLPNIQHIDTLIHVFFKGTWPRNSRGIYDRTHLRFFTRKNMHELIQGSGLLIEDEIRVFRRRDRLDSRFSQSPLEWPLQYVFKNLYTFQFIFVCTKA